MSTIRLSDLGIDDDGGGGGFIETGYHSGPRLAST